MSPQAALLSEDGVYRYSLEREWRDSSFWPYDDVDELRLACWVMLNPSTADAIMDDPTIRRCRSFSEREGCNGLVVVNLYGRRATDPAELFRPLYDPVGPENDRTIARMLVRQAVQLVIVAWGATGAPGKARRVAEVERIIGESGRTAWCLGTTADGSPRHPLYVKGDAELKTWWAP